VGKSDFIAKHLFSSRQAHPEMDEIAVFSPPGFLISKQFYHANQFTGTSDMPWLGTYWKKLEGCLVLGPHHGKTSPLPPAY
jgi:hypothetical protein